MERRRFEIDDNPYHGQRIEGRDADGSLEVILKATHEMEIIPMVFWYLPHVRILEPEWMNEMLVEKVQVYLKDS